MKRFKFKKKSKFFIDITIILIIIITILLLILYNKKISPKVIDIASSKLEEITTLYIKRDIIPSNVDLMKLVKVTKNNKDEILMIDTDYDYAYKIMKEIVDKIQKSIHNLEMGNITDFYNHREIETNNNNLYLKVPLGLNSEGTLLSSLGPKIPIKISFYEHVLGTIETKIEGYGINNSLLKVEMIIDLDQKLILPYKEKMLNKSYKLELGSKVIIGTVPNIYGGSLLQKSSTISS